MWYGAYSLKFRNVVYFVYLTTNVKPSKIVVSDANDSTSKYNTQLYVLLTEYKLLSGILIE